MKEVEDSNLQLLRDCLSDPLIEQSSGRTAKSKKARNKAGRKTATKLVVVERTETSDADELAEFVDVCISSSKFKYQVLTKQTVPGN